MLHIFLCCCFLAVVKAEYELPEARVEVLCPRGFRISIPDSYGVKRFSIHGKVNEGLKGRLVERILGHITNAENGRWTYSDYSTKLYLGDVIHYLTQVKYDDGKIRKVYSNRTQIFTVTEAVRPVQILPLTSITSTANTEQSPLYEDIEIEYIDFAGTTTKSKTGPERLSLYQDSPNSYTNNNKVAAETEFTSRKSIFPVTATSATTTSPMDISMFIRMKEDDDICDYTHTIYKGKSSCKGYVLLDETFSNGANSEFWTAEQIIAGSPDFEFCIYIKRPETIFINNSNLVIKPRLGEEIYGKNFIAEKFNLESNCTGTPGSSSCVMNPDAGFLVPPVLSSRITTKDKFSFKYGKVEIKAKLPKGDWLYPELYLNPVIEKYRPGHESGQIRIAFAPGNAKLDRSLSGGVILGHSKAARSYGIRKASKRYDLSEDFHRFGIQWGPESIILSVNDEEYGTIKAPSERGFASLTDELKLKNVEKLKTGTKFAPFDTEMYLTVGVGVGGFNFDDTTDGSKPWKNGERMSIKKFCNAQDQWKATWSEQSIMEIAYVKVWAL